MFFGDAVQDTRQYFLSCWEKHLHNDPLLPLEEQIVAVILDHPEYQPVLASLQNNLTQPYFPELGETNPFLHMGLHLAIREQITTDRPFGINKIFQSLLAKFNDSLTVEHLIMEQLAECLWLSQRQQRPPDEQQYLESLYQLTR